LVSIYTVSIATAGYKSRKFAVVDDSIAEAASVVRKTGTQEV